MAKTFLGLLGLMVLGAGGSLGAEIELGKPVWAYHEPTGAYFAGIPVEENNTVKGGAYLIVFFDTEVGQVPSHKIRPLNVKPGTPIMAKWTDGKFYPGKVAKTLGNAVYVHFDDGDKIWTSFAGIAQKTDE